MPTIQIVVLLGGKSDILTGFSAPVLLSLNRHGPLLGGVIPFGSYDCRVGPDVEFHHFRIEFEPFCKLVLWCKYLGYVSPLFDVKGRFSVRFYRPIWWKAKIRHMIIPATPISLILFRGNNGISSLNLPYRVMEYQLMVPVSPIVSNARVPIDNQSPDAELF